MEKGKKEKGRKKEKIKGKITRMLGCKIAGT